MQTLKVTSSRAMPAEKRDQSIEQITKQIRIKDSVLEEEKEPPGVQTPSSQREASQGMSECSPIQKKLDMHRAGGNETMLPHDILKHQQQNDPKLKR